MNELKLGAIDANIWVYTFNRQSALHLKSLRFVKQMQEVGLVITPQTVMEIYNVITDKRKVELPLTAVKAADILISLMGSYGVQIAVPQITTAHSALMLAKKRKIRGDQLIYDAFLAATLIDNGVEVLYTLNQKDFRGFGGLKVINPFE